MRTVWVYCDRALELENGSGAHHRRNAGADEATNSVACAPGMLSIPQLMKKTVEMLENDDKVRGVDFKVPIEKWASLQLSPNNQFSATAACYTGRLNYVRKMLTRSVRDDSHPAAHWNSALKRLWRHKMSLLISLLEEHLANDDELMPCELPTNTVIMAGCDDKSNIQVGDDVPLEATQRQSNRVMVQPGSSVGAGDHDFKGVNKLVPSVIHLMNQSTNPGESLHSGGPNGTGRTFVSVHDALLCETMLQPTCFGITCVHSSSKSLLTQILLMA